MENGLLTHLSQLEARERSRGGPDRQRSRLQELRAEAEELRGVRDQLEAEIRARKVKGQPGNGDSPLQYSMGLNVPTILQNPVNQKQRLYCEIRVLTSISPINYFFDSPELDVFLPIIPPSSSEGLPANVQHDPCFCQRLQELRSSADPRPAEDSPLLQMMTRHLDLTELLHAHQLIGGFNAVQTRQGRAVCVSLQTMYEGVFLDTFNLEMELKPQVRIGRHNVPPFIPLLSLAEQSHLETDTGAFLSMLSQHLNAFVGRRRQLQLVQEQHKSVEVMESNLLCSILVLLFTEPTEKTALLCTLEYSDHASCLPSRVHLDCEDKQLPQSPEWRSCCATLMKTPLHRALADMKKSRSIL